MKVILSITLLLSTFVSQAQDTSYARRIINDLTSSKYWGRGYTNNGVEKASRYIAEEFNKSKLLPLNGKSYFQDYSFPVNTFPGKMDLIINGKRLVPGRDFIVNPGSCSAAFKGWLKQTDSLHYLDSIRNFRLSVAKKLTWSVSTEVENHASVVVLKDKLPEGSLLSYEVDIENAFIERFPSRNICGIIKGKSQPDSLIVFTAHYDHLGGMGKNTYFPGANDNASGVSMILNLARYFQQNSPSCSIAFVCFSGEEAGLIGSHYFSEYPLFDLKKVKFLINLDLTGTGDEGITVVNATEFKKEFEILNEANAGNKYLPKIKSRGKAANSDHYYFSQRGVPSFFIYTNGGVKAYHDIYDISATLPLTEYEDLFRLLRDFVNRI